MAESAPVTERDTETEAVNKGFGKGSYATRKKVADALGRPELIEPDKFDQYLKDQRNADEKRLADEGKFRELADSKAKEADTERKQREQSDKLLQEERFRNQFIIAAQGKVADIDLALSMTREADRKFDSENRVVGIDTIVTRILTEKPILKAGAKGAIGSDTSGAGGSQEGGKHAAEIKKRDDEMKSIREKKSRLTNNDYARLEVLRSEIKVLKTTP